MVFVCVFNPSITRGAGKVVNTVPRALKKVYDTSSIQVREYATCGIIFAYHMTCVFLRNVHTYRVRPHALQKKVRYVQA
jgi:hypothetical protein